MRRALPLLVPALAGLVLATPASAPAQSINRCLGSDGTTIFTDRSCAALGAADAGQIHTDGRGGGDTTQMGLDGARGGFAIRGCARTPEALAGGVQAALQAQDVNKLANYYHWTGTSASGAVGLMDRLEQLAHGTMATATLDYPNPTPWFQAPPDMVASVGDAQAAPEIRAAMPEPAGARPGPAYLASLRAAPADDVAAYAAPLAEAPAADAVASVGDVPAPDTLYVENTPALPPHPATAPADPPTGLRIDGTHFSLRRNMGCWWIQL